MKFFKWVVLISLTCIVAMGFIRQKNVGIKKIYHKEEFKLIADTTDELLKKTLPSEGKIINDKPVGKHWVDLLKFPGDWMVDSQYWKFNNSTLHGDYNGGKFHNYCWTKKNYTDYELNILIKMIGKDANSGVCIRLHPTEADNAPGYQVDMGPGYWGSLWEERRAGMVQKYPDDLAKKLVKENDWNHYYIIAKGHHIQAWLNDVKTIDTIHNAGFEDGAIGFQLCHGDKHTIVDVKMLYLRTVK